MRQISLIIAILCTARLVSAEVMVGESLEWLVDSSTGIGVYSVTEFTAIDRGNNSRNRILLKKKTVFKGSLPENLTYLVQDWEVDNSPAKKSHELLIFVTSTKQLNSIRYHINLSSPPKRGFKNIAFSKDFQLLTTRAKILDIAQRRVKLNRNVKIADPARVANVFAHQGNGALRMEVPFQSTAHQALWGGSSCYLVVPADEDIRQQLLKQLTENSVWMRADAASCLVAFPSKDTKLRLRELLKDPAKSTVTTYDKKNGKQEKSVYPVREAAHRALLQLGENIE